MTLITKQASELELVRTSDDKPSRSFTVYLIRHGEAKHNVEEKRAQKNAWKRCCERGLSRDHSETVRAVDEARKSVLRDPSFFDATLTDQGKSEARCARSNLRTCINEGLPAPGQVMTSPLQRCLGTVEELFPDNNVDIRVEEHLRERLTGRPADNRHSAEILEERFPRFNFGKLRSLSQSNILSDCRSTDETYTSDSSSASGLGMADDSTECSRSISRQGSSDFFDRTASSMNADVELENDNSVRKRAFNLFKLLEESNHDSVAVVTHKGFLRALERGCFGISGSPEFKNCEMRVYRIEMTPGNLFLDSVHRLR